MSFKEGRIIFNDDGTGELFLLYKNEDTNKEEVIIREIDLDCILPSNIIVNDITNTEQANEYLKEYDYKFQLI
jgi:hypothetical protein